MLSAPPLSSAASASTASSAGQYVDASAASPERQPLLPAAPAAPPEPTPAPPQATADTIELLEHSQLRRLFDRARQLSESSKPAFRWGSGAVGTSIVAAAMVLSTQRDSAPGEKAVVNTLCGLGAPMYLGGVGELMRAARAGGNRESVTTAVLAGAALVGLHAAGMLWASEVPPVYATGLALYAVSVHAAAGALAQGFARDPQVSDVRHLGRLTSYIGVGVGLGCLLGALAVASGVIWRLGAFHISGNMVLAVTAGAHALLACSTDMGRVLYGRFSAASSASAGDWA